ncbi:FAD/NAD(P)-binding protein [soil metagenome]
MTSIDRTALATDASTETGAPSLIILGGGASAVFVVVGLVEQAAKAGRVAPRITVVERESTVGLGIAYGRAEPHHLLNSPVGKMGVSEADPDGFLRWCRARGLDVGAGTFVPRRLFGEYVAEQFATIAAGSAGRIRHLRGDAAAAATTDDGVEVTLADGSRLTAEILVLAVGNPPPGTWPSSSTRVIQDPWGAGALAGVSDADRVLLIGTGLTMVDIATTLARRHPGIRLTATSRNLLIPRTHLTSPAAPGPGLADDLTALGDLISAVGRQVRSARTAGEPWQALIDGMRPQLNPIWARLSVADRRRFLAHVARFWDVHRHRMAPSVSAELGELRASGVLTLSRDVVETDFDLVINCTGPRSAATTGWNSLIDSLVRAGTVHADPLGLGLAARSDGALLDAGGNPSERLFAVGPALRGSLWETVAIPEIRQEVTRLAAALG